MVSNTNKGTTGEVVTLGIHERNYYQFWFWMLIACAAVFVIQTVIIDHKKNIISVHDPTYYYSYVRSLVIDHNLDLTNEYEYFNIQRPVVEKTGYPINPFSIGFPLLVLPFFLLAHGVILFLNLFGFELSATGFSTPYQLSVSLGSMVYGYVGLLICYRFTKKYFPEHIAFLAITTIFLSSNIIFYTIREPFVSHLTSFFAVSLFIYSWDGLSESSRLRDWLVLGLAAGFMILVRQQNIAFLCIPALDVVFHIIQKEKNPWCISPLKFAISSLTFCLVLSLQMWAWWAVFGSFVVYSYGSNPNAKFAYAMSPKIFSVLFSSKHGLISWNPVILFSLTGTLLLLKNQRRIAVLFLSAFLFQLYINASWFNWWFGHSFGQRAFINCTLIFIVGLSHFLFTVEKIIPLKKILFGLSLLVVWNIVMILAFMSEIIPYDDYFSWVEFISKLPALPDQIIKKILSLR